MKADKTELCKNQMRKPKNNIFKKVICCFVACALLFAGLPFCGTNSLGADCLDGHSEEIYKKIGNFTNITEGYSMAGGVVNKSSGNWTSTYITGKAKMEIYKIPLPQYHPSLTIDRFILRFGRGANASYKVMKIDYDKWDFSSLPMTVPLDDARLAPMIAGSYSSSLDANDAPLVSVESAVAETYITYADISSYAREAYENMQPHFYVAVGSWNSTHNVSSSSMSDTTYKAANLYPGFYYNIKYPYTEEKASYPKVSPEEFEELFKTTAAGGHPYLFGRQADFDRVKEYAFGKDSAMTEMYAKFKDDATEYVDKSVSKITTDIRENSYISRAQSALTIIMKCAFVYMIEGDTDYADRALAEAMYFVEEMETWGRAQSLDVNFTATGIAICYDWLYDYMTEEQRTTVGNAIFEKHLNEVYDFFNNPTDPQYKWSFHQQYLGYSNHAMTDNTSVFVQALAVSDVSPEKSASIMSLALEHLTRHNGPFDHLYPDSGWYEGSSYWSMVGPLMARMFSAMDSAFGTCFGFEDNAYITGTAYFPIYTQSNRTRILYCDGYAGKTEASEFFWYGKMSGDEALQSYVLKNKFYTTPLLCLWYNPLDVPKGELELKKDKLFRDIDVGSMRSSWEESNEVFAAMTVQNPRDSHAFMAMGTIMLDALGETWITNPGKEYYSIGDYWNTAQNGTRWTYYSTRPEANSCVVINPSEDGGQLVTSPAMIDKLESSDSAAYMVSDLSTAYADVNSYRRGLMLFDNRSKVLLQDEISLKDTSDVYSFINVYQADIDLAPDGSYAIFSKGKKHMYVKVISNKPHKLKTFEACSEALGTSPNPDGQTDFTADFERLAIEFEDVSGDVNLSLVFVPFVSDNLPELSFRQIPISQWSVDENTPKEPVLSSLKVNGKAVEDFRSDVKLYRVPMEYFEATIEAEAPNAHIEIKNNYKENTYEIYLTDKTTGAKNHYCIEVLLSGKITADTYVGGSLSDDTHFLSANHGYEAEVRMRIMTRYSFMSYYKLLLPHIPCGKTIDSASLVLNQFRVTNSTFKDAYEFHLVDPNHWDENTITYYSAPVRHSYNEAWYPYKKAPNPGTYDKGLYTTESASDLTLQNLNIKTVPKRNGFEERFYEPHYYDVTPLVEKSGFSDLGREDNEFSFGMGHVVLTSYSSSSNSYIASKENPNEALRPKLLVELDNEEGAKGVYAEKPKLVKNPLGDELYFTSQNEAPAPGESFGAITYAVNFEEEQKTVRIYVAQYDENGKLVAVSFCDDSINAGESKTIGTPAYTIHKDQKATKAIVLTDKLKPVKN